MKQDNEATDQFQQFKEQYLTYAVGTQVAQNFHDTRKVKISKIDEKQKLKIIPETQLKTNLLNQFKKNNKEKKQHGNSGRIIGIGDALFRSNFQSGNINSVKKLSPHHYQITLEQQTNANRISAWFYFICQGLKGQIKFTIKGFTKSSSLFNEGMKVCYRQLSEGSKWRRGCSKISYRYLESDVVDENGSYALTFSFFFKNQFPNSVQFAYCFPYTFNHLLNLLMNYRQKIKIDVLGETFEGRQIPLLTIGNQNSQNVIIISSRVHPGETVGSLMMEGFIKYLLSQNHYSKILRENFLFKIVPMINIDGVTHGNYRFSGAGYDLNRKWKSCTKYIHSQVYYLKEMIKEISSQKQVLMYIDMHGHSRQKNTFFYGCCPKNKNQDKFTIKPKQFPFLMSVINSGIRYDYCSYSIQKSKEGTARVSMWKYLQVPFVYTMEASFCGTDKNNYLISDYQGLGANLCEGICLNFWQFCENHQVQLKQEFLKKMYEFYNNPKLQEVQCLGNSSDSEPQAGQISQAMKNQLKKGQKTNKIQIPKFKIQEKATRNKSIAGIGIQKSINETNITSKVNQHAHKSLRKEQEERKNKSQLIGDSSFLKTQIFDDIPLDAEQKLKYLFANKRMFSEFSDKRSITRFEPENKEKVNTKKKTVSFEGAQYRRVRKMVEQNNKFSSPKDQGIVTVCKNNFKNIEKINTKQRNGSSIFPTTQIKFRKTFSNDPKLRKKMIQKQFHQTVFHERDVFCAGKQFF